MALPTLSTRVPSWYRNRSLYLDWQRERRAEKQRELEVHARDLKRQSVITEMNALWTSPKYYNRR